MKTVKKNRTARRPKTRASLDKKLAALAAHERIHQLFHRRPNEGDWTERLVRDWWSVKQLSEQLDNPAMRCDRAMSSVNGQPVSVSNLAEDTKAAYEEAKKLTIGYVAGAFRNWNPEFFERVAVVMRRVAAEPSLRFNPFNPTLPLRQGFRVFLLERSKAGPLNLFRLACEVERVKDPRRMTEEESARVETTRKAFGKIARRLKLPTLGKGHPKKCADKAPLAA